MKIYFTIGILCGIYICIKMIYNEKVLKRRLKWWVVLEAILEFILIWPISIVYHIWVNYFASQDYYDFQMNLEYEEEDSE